MKVLTDFIKWRKEQTKMNDEKSCEFCFYECFDGRAYPCSLCIRGLERQEMFKPKTLLGKHHDYIIVDDGLQETEMQTVDSNSDSENAKHTSDCAWK